MQYGLADFWKHQGLSEYWRRNTSNTESTELANLLRALRKVAGHLGQNVGRIEYAGMSHGDQASIVLEPSAIMGEYPVPAAKVDFLVGLVTHEALHKIEWTDRVWKVLEPAMAEMEPLHRIIFQKIVFFGEDNYVDFIADHKVFGLYTQKTRRNAMESIQSRLRQDIVTIDLLFFYWWLDTWAELSEEIDEVYREPLKTLSALNEELKAVGQGDKGATARCDQRAEQYLATWEALKETIKSWKILDKRLLWYTTVESSPKKPQRAAGRKKTADGPLSQDLIDEIETQLAANSVDITPIIRSVVGFDNEDVVPISRWDFNFAAHPLIDKRMISRLRATFQNYAARNKVISRGLTSGKVDRRRLYRAPINGRCFRQIDHIPNLDWSVTLLMDASGSMRGNKWRMVENTVANLHKALQGYQNRLQAFAYFESDGICMLSSLLKGKQLLSIPPNGQTASGQAIIAAAYYMPKGVRRNVLIHVTDGESNFGVDVQYGIDYCHEQGIHLVTLGCGIKDREIMTGQYGRTIQFLQHFGQLPRAIENLLKWTFLYGTKPHLRGDDFLKVPGGAFIDREDTPSQKD